MIKALILDIDGILVGEKIGYNSPHPHPEVIARLKAIRERGIPISLCTGKPYYAVEQIIEDAGLHNLHITEGGAVITDPIDNVVLKSHNVDTETAERLVASLLSKGVYTEVYTLDTYWVQKDQKRELTKTHEHILQTAPQLVGDLLSVVSKQPIVKIMPVAKDDSEKEKVIEIYEAFKEKATLSWGTHPIALPHQFAIITAQGISKRQAAHEIASQENVKPADMLGVGDSTSDWQFIQDCGYGATLENGSPELKELLSAKGSQMYIGTSVDANGILKVLDYFNL
jgi:HAD superfamily hydrolase (TIGR01484 family)